ncbi:L,D-transpeptidase family protein [Methylotenera mobilis]|uniref:ErfK/YbiS/YcfS/YnhG family protein n=1 Tax=Methylotenera mobilis (strain JLW8 / ATCC BAA-1282 / DSM 17540) TaxID=583345 RepID=C6WU20_METML|nr:L,D-transpeptidase family protein [Methylotenera mobilis]ACT47419.1 ErfK/YbiS/YcfS/YnhG family protein [Methylotenera mobilis JLW8]
MMINKALTYTLLAAITLVPWNATAVNRFSFGNLLPKASFGSAATIASNVAANLVEELLVKSLLEISAGKHQQALNTIDQLIQSVPNFKLAHLVRGDLLMAQGKYLQAFGDPGINRPEAVQDLQDEARVRIERYLAKQSQAKQPNLILAPNAQQTHLMLIDTSKSRLYLYEKHDNQLKYVADYYITVGKNGVEKQSEGDKRTPIGVYFASTKLKQQLPDFYGEGAYPLSYPNEWDKAHNRNGSGIWLHGTPSSTYSRPPRASDGCVVVANQDLKALEPVLQSGKTPIIIANNLQWLNSSAAPEAEKEVLNSAINHWLNDWRAQDTEKYLSHYSKDFSTNGINYEQWAEHKYRVQASKPDIDISLSNISMFSYPDPQKKLVVVDFTQSFNSPHLKNVMQKRQYWIQEGNSWKIIYEGTA